MHISCEVGSAKFVLAVGIYARLRSLGCNRDVKPRSGVRPNSLDVTFLQLVVIFQFPEYFCERRALKKIEK